MKLCRSAAMYEYDWRWQLGKEMIKEIMWLDKRRFLSDSVVEVKYL